MSYNILSAVSNESKFSPYTCKSLEMCTFHPVYQIYLDAKPPELFIQTQLIIHCSIFINQLRCLCYVICSEIILVIIPGIPFHDDCLSNLTFYIKIHVHNVSRRLKTRDRIYMHKNYQNMLL